jgi:hypothetical protein
MKYLISFQRTIIVLFFLAVVSNHLTAQNLPGYINRTATAVAGRAVLDPNGDGFSSATTAGFGAPSDQATSEIAYSGIRSYSTEPGGDISTGPAGGFSDFVQDGSNIGFYQYFNATNWLFRFRLGSIVAGGKGYSVLIDTDGKFGASGATADPNYVPSTSNTNGNPGFEIEIVLETNSRIAIYNVDGTASPVLVTSYTNWQDMSQISLALTNFSGNPDFFYDFYVPFSALQGAPFNLTAVTPVRLTATTVTNPGPAIGSIKSDIYGVTNNSNTGYEDFIGGQPPAPPGSPTGTMCTAAPVVSGPIGAGTVTISGSWKVSVLSGALTTTTVTVYKNGTSVGTIMGVTSGATWSLPGITVVNGDIITAKAQSTGENMCVVSNSVSVQGCNSSNIPSTTGFTVTCSSTRGLEGTFAAGNTVKLYYINPTTLVANNIAGPASNSPTFGYSGSNWYYNGTAFNGSNIPSACTGGSQDITHGSYYVTTIASSSACESAPLFACIGNTYSPAATPVITQAVLYSNNTIISGTGVAANANVYLWINGQLRTTVVASAVGAFSFAGLILTLNDAIEVRSMTTSSCISNAVTRTVTCFTNTPSITADINSQVAAGAAITGSSTEPAGTTIRLYNVAGNLLVATVTVQAGGSWTSAPYRNFLLCYGSKW